MNSRTIESTAAAFAFAALALAAPSAGAEMACRDLAQLRLDGTLITTATEVSGPLSTGPGPALDVPPLCRVAGTITPAIRFEVWMPVSADYNGRFQAVGGGGLAGNISYAAMADAVRAGYASASTDTGHRSGDSYWLGDPQRREDYGHRAIHEMTVKAKAVIDAYYGRGPAYSYFNGCSTGGRQGLMEAQRYPRDYDGIVSGAPVNDFTRLHMGQLWTAHATLIPEGAVLTAEDFALVNEAVMAQCDADDGVEDGVLADPTSCDFDPRDLVCRGRARGNDSCLAEPKVTALENIYAGAVNPRTGVQVYPGLEPGGESAQPGNPGWGMIMNGRTPFFIDIPVLGGMGFENDDWDWRTFDFDEDVTLIDAKLAHVLNAVDPDLRDFEADDGKLIIWHGWNDPGVMPQRTLDYYGDIMSFADRAGAGPSFVEGFTRLYMLPGVGHCSGGAGPDQVDWMSAIVDWVENDRAPERVVASSTDGSVTRPLCPHPQIAVYDGGDTDDAASFVCE